jgi:hypothetical protein
MISSTVPPRAVQRVLVPSTKANALASPEAASAAQYRSTRSADREKAADCASSCECIFATLPSGWQQRLCSGAITRENRYCRVHDVGYIAPRASSA